MTGREPVVVRNGPRKYAVAAIVGVLEFVFSWGLVAAVVTGDPGWPIRESFDPGRVGEIVYWVIVGPVMIFLIALGVFACTLRQDFYSDHVAIRRFLRFRSLAVPEVESIYWTVFHTTPAVGTVPAQLAPRLRIRGHRGNAFLDEKLDNYWPAMRIVDGWVQSRPHLVRGTNAEDFFVDRKIIPPAAPAGK